MTKPNDQHPLQALLEDNRAWAEETTARDPQFFEELARGQSPDVLWIGCSDSRVPANQVVGAEPGALFVHRNIANVVVQTDLNSLSVIQYAVEMLEVGHIVVCGHYGCGGVQAALRGERLGLIDNWLRHVRAVIEKHEAQLEGLDAHETADRCCELNVIEQVAQVAQTTVVQEAWARGQALTVHGWIYGLADGRLRDLGVSVSLADDLEPIRRRAVKKDRRPRTADRR